MPLARARGGLARYRNVALVGFDLALYHHQVALHVVPGRPLVGWHALGAELRSGFLLAIGHQLGWGVEHRFVAGLRGCREDDRKRCRKKIFHKFS